AIPDIQPAAHEFLRSKRMRRIAGKEIRERRRFGESDALEPTAACRRQQQMKLRFVASVVHDLEGKFAHELSSFAPPNRCSIARRVATASMPASISTSFQRTTAPW